MPLAMCAVAAAIVLRPTSSGCCRRMRSTPAAAWRRMRLRFRMAATDAFRTRDSGQPPALPHQESKGEQEGEGGHSGRVRENDGLQAQVRDPSAELVGAYPLGGHRRSPRSRNGTRGRLTRVADTPRAARGGGRGLARIAHTRTTVGRSSSFRLSRWADVTARPAGPRPPPRPRQRDARTHRHRAREQVEQDVYRVEHAAGQKRLDALVE